MALSLTTVTGNLELPDGRLPLRGRVIFTMVGWASSSPHLFFPGPVDVSPAPDGTFSVQLQTTDDLDVEYEVVFSFLDHLKNSDVTLALGRIRVPAGGPVSLASLLPVRIPAEFTDHHRIKRGDSFVIAGICLNDYGQRQNLNGTSVSSALKGPDLIVRPLTVSVINSAAGEIEITMSSGLTAGLPVGRHEMDVKFSNGVRVNRSVTADVFVDEEVTP